VRSSIIGVPVSAAILAISLRAAAAITAPVGFWQLGVRYTSRAAVAAIRSRSAAGTTPPSLTGTVDSRAPAVRSASSAPK
jgi:cytochrome oxidase assembly protein ShyY1